MNCKLKFGYVFILPVLYQYFENIHVNTVFYVGR